MTKKTADLTKALWDIGEDPDTKDEMTRWRIALNLRAATAADAMRTALAALLFAGGALLLLFHGPSPWSGALLWISGAASWLTVALGLINGYFRLRLLREVWRHQVLGIDFEPPAGSEESLDSMDDNLDMYQLFQVLSLIVATLAFLVAVAVESSQYLRSFLLLVLLPVGLFVAYGLVQSLLGRGRSKEE